MQRTRSQHKRTLAARLIGLVVIWSLVAVALPSWSFLAPAPHNPGQSSADETSPSPLAPPTGLPAAPVIDPHLPTLSVVVAVDPDPIVVGQQATITVRVTNTSVDPANDLTVLLPLPAGVTTTTPTIVLPDALAAEARAAGLPDAGWTWAPTLGGKASATVTVTVTVTQAPAGGALVLLPAVSAAGLSQPVRATGGALVLDAPPTPTMHTFTPGSTATLDSADGHVTVAMPGDAANTSLTLGYQRLPSSGPGALPPLPTLHRGFAPFSLTATDATGNDVHQFAHPVSIAVHYTPEQLRATGIREDDLTLFWYDTSAVVQLPGGGTRMGRWIAEPTEIDRATHTARTTSSHFSDRQLGDQTQASTTYLPSLDGWQVGLFTGSATYSMPIAVPAGAAGTKPNLELRYDSSATDGYFGTKPLQQAGWVGKGWSLEPGYIARTDAGEHQSQYFTLVLNGHAYTLLPFWGNTAPTGSPSGIEWHTTDESFMKIAAYDNGQPNGHGAILQGSYLTTHKWEVWAKDGTRYEFADDLWYGWGDGGPEDYKWMLTSITDTHGNVIHYSYEHDINHTYNSDRTVEEWIDRDAWLKQVSWGGALNAPDNTTDNYLVKFDSTGRGVDAGYAWSEHQFGGAAGAPQQTRMLLDIKVQSRSDGTNWKLVRQYNLSYAGCSLTSDGDGSIPKLALCGVTRVGNDVIDGDPQHTGTVLDTLTFTYGNNGNTRQDAGYAQVRGDWNRLTRVVNGRGGTVTFAYDNAGEQFGPTDKGTSLGNYRRVTQKRVDGGFNLPVSVWNYTYEHPEVNGLGSSLLGAGQGETQDLTNDIGVVINSYFPPPHGESFYWSYLLMTPRLREFRGHSKVTVTNPDGSKVEHYFYQGNADPTCPISPHQDQIWLYADGSDQCSIKLLTNQSFKGREFDLIAYDANGVKLTETQTTYTADAGLWNFSLASTQPLSGMFRTHVQMATKVERIFDPGGGVTERTTTYTYDGYDNLTSTQESVIGGTAAYRTTKTYYAPVNTVDGNGNGRYIVDRPIQSEVLDGSGHLLTLTTTFYDNSPSDDAPVKGDVTRVRKYLLPQPPQSPITESQLASVWLTGVDTTATYDNYGNTQTTSTYTTTGTTSWGTATPHSFYNQVSPTNPHTTTTTYDTTFHSFPTEVKGPTATHPDLSTYQPDSQMQWDYRMGTLLSVTDVPNNVTTSATYDAFGRIWQLTKPLDASPTYTFTYYDNAYTLSQQPTNYHVQQLVSSPTGTGTTLRGGVTFYDGLGRAIQTKSDGYDLNSIVTDTFYGYGTVAGVPNTRIQKASQPRYVTLTSGASIYPTSDFWSPTPLAADATERWTTTAYDALDRPVRVTTPDNNFTTVDYTRTGLGWLATTTDAKGHQTARETDLFGRLRTVTEFGIAGSSGCGGTSFSAFTQYTYSELDLLVGIIDGLCNHTTIAYDSLGRKTDMTDPDMGAWQYHNYDGAGNLLTQQDANGNITSFNYDELDRLLKTTYSGPNTTTPPTGPNAASPAQYTYDNMANGNKGGGRRTGMSNAAGSTNWVYDARGRVTGTTVTAVLPGGQGQTSGPWDVQSRYDSADQVTSQTDPSNAEVDYTYDIGGRPTKLCPRPTAMPGPHLTADHPWTGLGSDPRTGPLLCYAQDATYTALGQPTQRTLGNGLIEKWSYAFNANPATPDPMARLQRHTLTAPPPANTTLMDRAYSQYDPVGNLLTLTDNAFAPGQAQPTQTQTFDYDPRDRLVQAATTGNTTAQYNVTYAYDAIGNLTRQGITSYAYPTSGNNAIRPHAPTSVGGSAYTYDANGNTKAIGSNDRVFTWDARNLPIRIDTKSVPAPAPPGRMDLGGPSDPPGKLDGGGPATAPPSRIMPTAPNVPSPAPPGRPGPTVAATPNPNPISRTPPTEPHIDTEIYTYDADGERLTRTDAYNMTTVYLGSTVEIDGQAGKTFAGRIQFAFAGQVIAQATTSTAGATTTVYLHTDHLGSVAMTTSESGAVLHKVEYTPFGAVRSGNVPETTANYTGQKRDETGLLYYHARYYDPVLGRFLSPDSLWGDFAFPQTLHPYSYVYNNPLGLIDPSGNDPAGFDPLASGRACSGDSDPPCRGNDRNGAGASAPPTLNLDASVPDSPPAATLLPPPISNPCSGNNTQCINPSCLDQTGGCPDVAPNPQFFGSGSSQTGGRQVSRFS